MKKLLTGLFVCFFASRSFAVTPQLWEQNLPQHFAAGDPQSVSITSEGEIMLAPQMKKIYEGTDSILWEIISDSKGNIYAATGNEGRVLKVDPAGKATVLLDTDELEVQTLVLDRDENLYAGTSPDGKIYQIQPDGKSKVFFDPPDKYIWCLAVDDAGNLYAGTGVQGKIYKIDRQGKGTELVDTAESNITSLTWTKENELIAGSDPNGVLYRIDSTGKAFVLFDSDQQQITSIFSPSSGEIYFSCVSSTRAVQDSRTPQPSPAPGAQQPDTMGFSESTEVVATVETTPTPLPQPAATVRPAGASQLYRRNTDGTTELMYSSAEDQILDIASFKDSILISTGKKAKLVLIDKNKKNILLLKSPEDQITHLVSGKKVLVATANPGNIYELLEDHSTKGTYFSDTKDTITSSSWGAVAWKGATPAGSTMTFFTRSGNTRTADETWSAWQQITGAKVASPKARFIQWKVEFTTTNPKESPVLQGFSLAYLQQNLRPEVTAITIHPPGIVFKRAPMFPQDTFAGLDEESASDASPQADIQPQMVMDPTLTGKREIRRGFQTITWTASDDNQDRLIFTIYYKPLESKEWRLLARDLRESIFAWDTQTIPDGTYQLRVEANDNLSNPSNLSLSGKKESRTFDVDNSAPKVDVVKSSKANNKLILEVHAEDEYSPLLDFQYSVVPGKWEDLFPVDSINDSKSEEYRVEVKEDASFVILKSTDRMLNVSTIRVPIP